MFGVVALEPPLHWNVKLPLPPLGVAVNVTVDALGLHVTELIVTVGFGFTRSVPVQLVMQPLESVMVTL